MSGIAGIYYLDGRPVEQADLQRMLDSIAHRGPDGCGIWTKGSVALGCQLLRVTPESANETQPFIHPSGIVVVFDGRLDNRKELLETLQNSTEIFASSPDPAFVLAAYKVFGENFAKYLIGDFVLGLFDLDQQKLILARDAIGVRPLYFYSNQRQFLFASEIKALLAHPQVPTCPNDEYLANFLFLRLSGDSTEGRTFFEGIYSLPPTFRATVTPEGLSKRQYWDFDVTRRTRFKSFKEYAEGFYYYFEQAVRRRLRSMSPVAVSVSGGLDSSSIFCLAETLKRKGSQSSPDILGFSYIFNDGTPQDEKSFLLDIENDYTVSIRRILMGPEGIMEGRKREVWHGESPFLDNLRNVIEPLYKNVQQSGARILLSGTMGDQILFDQVYLLDLFNNLAWYKVRAHLKEFGKWNLDVDSKSFTRFFFRNLLKSYAPHTILSYLSGIKRKVINNHLRFEGYEQKLHELAYRRTSRKNFAKTPLATAHSKSLYNEIKSTYKIFLWEWANKVASIYGIEYAYPFVDQDLVSYLMAIPGEVQTWNGIPKGILREGMRGVLPTRIIERRCKADFTDLSNDRVACDFHSIVQSLESGRMAVRLGYVNEKTLSSELKRLRDHIRRPDCLVSWSLYDLLGLEIWLQVFFDETIAEREVDVT
ncbi:MAG: asparagine synthetase B family protein, partial [Candidatus Hodarchaeota archaeon]